MRVAATVVVNDEEREQLLAWSRGRSTPHRLVLRSKIILMAADGLQNKKIAESLHVRPKVVTRWRNRFVTHRLNGIRTDAPRPGAQAEAISEEDRLDHRSHPPHKASRG